MSSLFFFLFFFFFNDTATTEIYTLSLHDALPISENSIWSRRNPLWKKKNCRLSRTQRHWTRSEEHTSELQSRRDLVCRLLLEKKKKKKNRKTVKMNMNRGYDSTHYKIAVLVGRLR